MTINGNELGLKPIFTKYPKRSNKPVGGHSVVLLKYTSEYYSFINSWGTNWGDAGFFK